MKRAALPIFVLPLLLIGLLCTADALPAVAAAAAVVWIFVSVPLGIVTLLDWFRGGAPAHTTGRFAHAAMRVPILLLGVAGLVIGVGVLAWLAYGVVRFAAGGGAPLPNGTLSPRRINPVGSLFTMVAIAGFGWYLIRLALRGDAREPEENAGATPPDDDEY